MYIKFVPLVRWNVEEGFEYKPSIIAFSKRPWLFNESKDKKRVECVQYKYLIYINLYILELEFRFLGRNAMEKK